jgi:hypothetical protein
MLERCLVEFCSTTLASLKSASLFNASFDSRDAAEEQIARWNECFEHKGIRLFLLRFHGTRALIYVYRLSHLEATLSNPEIQEFLAKYGYESSDTENDTEYALLRLRQRILESGDFPHEIGVFLGYPLGDVIGFIDNEGRNFKCAGCWKVYCDEGACRKKFAQFKKCQRIYMRLWQEGRSVLQLTVAA